MSILPILAYGDPLLKEKGKPIDRDYPGLDALIDNMWETMYQAKGVGLAAPQIGRRIRLFLVDASPFADEDPSLKDFKKVFINARMLDESGDPWLFNEGCLSFPELREDLMRRPEIRMSYQDQDFREHEESFSGLAARIIQHEYDHIEGILMIDRISPLKRTLLRRTLNNISRGLVRTDYMMKAPRKKR